MGTWGSGLLDSDGALDAIGDITNWLEEEVAKLADVRANEQSVARLAGALGLLLELSPYSFEATSHWSKIDAALQQQQRAFNKLEPAAADLMGQLLEGGGAELAARKDKRPAELKRALGSYLEGKREPVLLQHSEAIGLVQETADRCVAMLEEYLDEPELDLYESADGMGLLGLLLLLPPCHVDAGKLKQWHEYMRKSYRTTRDEDPENPDLEHFDEYLVNLELAFKLALERFA